MKPPLVLILILLWIQSLFAQNKHGGVTKHWLCSVKIQDKTIDFVLSSNSSVTKIPNYILWNGRERIDLYNNKRIGDSLHCPVSVFESKLILPLQPIEKFAGYYITSKNQRLPFSAVQLTTTKRTNSNPDLESNQKFKGTWKIYFHQGGLATDSGILITTLKSDSIYGTILTETGDYRYLNGKINAENTAYLQTLDGAHNYRFDIKLVKDSIVGTFIYRPKGTDLFYGIKTQNAIQKSGFEAFKTTGAVKFNFTGSDETGRKINEQHVGFKNKGLVLQILGTWCPNCLDETRFLTEAYANKPKNVEFIGLAFERNPEHKAAFERINVLRAKLKVPYQIYLGGIANKDSAKLVVPFLSKVFAFPTTVFVKADGSILKVHSGFSGPATGKLYTEWKKTFYEILKEITP